MKQNKYKPETKIRFCVWIKGAEEIEEIKTVEHLIGDISGMEVDEIENEIENEIETRMLQITNKSWEIYNEEDEEEDEDIKDVSDYNVLPHSPIDDSKDIYCPYCSEEYDDYPDFIDEKAIVTCESCEKDFLVELSLYERYFIFQVEKK